MRPWRFVALSAPMALIRYSQLQLAFGHVPLLDHADFSVEPGERVGLIGRNGTGKSSLLGILSGRLRPDDGQEMRMQGLRQTLVEQEPDLGDGPTVMDAVLASPSDIDTEEDWARPARAAALLGRVQIDPDTPITTLSGGMRKRVALARALVDEPDLLLLDEPTNHLDFDGILWLEELLRGFSGSVVVITHDRHFLDAVATRIVELDRGRLASFPGNFSTYQVRKAEMLAAEALENARQDKLLAQEEIWIRQGVEARRTRSVSRINRLHTLRAERQERRERTGTVNLNVDAGQRSGKLVVEMEGVSKTFGERTIVRDFSTTILRGDRVGLIGPNGAGKTTLLRLMLGLLEPDSGTVRHGTRLEIAYFDQMRAQLDEDATLVDIISPGSEWVEIGGERKHVMSYLGDFLFSPQRARSPVRSLSGGERARLLLARLFARPANVLVLDEPTNDLDIETLELLEELLQEYTGTVFLVSHDRTFLDNVVTQTLASEGDGIWRDYVGGYDDYLRQRATAASHPAKAAAPVVESRAPAAAASRQAKAVRMAPWEKRELEELPARIEGLEQEQTVLSARLSDPALYQEGPQALEKVQKRLSDIDTEVLTLMERWEALEARAKGN